MLSKIIEALFTSDESLLLAVFEELDRLNSTTVVPMIILIPNITEPTDIMGQLKKSRFQESD